MTNNSFWNNRFIIDKIQPYDKIMIEKIKKAIINL